MKILNSCRSNLHTISLPIVCVVLITAILAVDLAVPLGIAMGVPYVVVVLISLRLPRKATILIAVVCSLLTIGAYFYKPAVPELWKAACNRSLAVFVIWASAVLGLQRKAAEEQREQAIREREKAIAELRVLRGILPICASCKKIRDEQGEWVQVERYIHHHSEADFSHGFCQECIKKLYPEFLTPEPGNGTREGADTK